MMAASQGGRLASSSIWIGSSTMMLYGSHPGTSPNGHIDNRAIPYLADVRLRVDRDRCLFPCVELPRRHRDQCSVRSDVIGERVWIVARMALAPKSVLHYVHPLDQRIIPTNSAANRSLSSAKAF